MGWKFDIDAKRVVGASQQVLWDRVSNHDGTGEWVKRWVKRVKVHTPGTEDRNGVGAIRGLKLAGWPEIMERVVLFEPPHKFKYSVISGLPMVTEQLGEVSVTRIDDDRSEVGLESEYGVQPMEPIERVCSRDGQAAQMGVSGRPGSAGTGIRRERVRQARRLNFSSWSDSCPCPDPV